MIKLNTLKGYEDVEDGYFLTKCLRVVSTRKNRLNKNGFLFMKILKDRDGYNTVFPRKKDGKTKTCRMCRLIALAFIENTENKPQVDHINRNKQDDSLGNLRWVTCRENSLNRGKSKQRHNVKKIDVILNGVVIDTLTAPEIVNKYNVRRTSIYQVLTPKSRAKSVKGYAFKYSECND